MEIRKLETEEKQNTKKLYEEVFSERENLTGNVDIWQDC